MGHPNRPKIGPKRVLRRYFFKNVDFHAASAGVVFGAFLGPQDGAKIVPRSPQDGLKTNQKRCHFLKRFFDRFWVVLVPSWCSLGPSWGLRVSSWGRLGALLGPQDGPKMDTKSPYKIHRHMLRARGGPKTAQDDQKTPKKTKNDPKQAPKTTKNDPQRPPRRPKNDPKRSQRRF